MDELIEMVSGLTLSPSELHRVKERAERIERGDSDKDFVREVQEENRRYLALIAFDLANADEAFIHDCLRLSLMETTENIAKNTAEALQAALCAYQRILSLFVQDYEDDDMIP
jgi:hypothetical protein